VCVDFYTMNSGWSGQVIGHIDLDSLAGNISFVSGAINTTFTTSSTSGSGLKLKFATRYPSSSSIDRKSAVAMSMFARSDLPANDSPDIEDENSTTRAMPYLVLSYRPAEAELDLLVYSSDSATVRLEYSTDLVEWMPLATLSGGPEGRRFIDTGVTEQALRFYRAVRLPGQGNGVRSVLLTDEAAPEKVRAWQAAENRGGWVMRSGGQPGEPALAPWRR
jgi:hypothetical protein